ncbi:MAG: hypothetical protein HQK54_16560, partial [Oligoflexales bacterium]|nr:hypothetical protein [Oligoflexales bacterium]
MKYLLLTIFFLFPGKAFAEAPSAFVIEDGKKYYELGSSLEYLEDESGKLGLDDITSGNPNLKWEKSRERVPGFGFTRSAYWFRFTLKNETSFKGGRDWILEISYPILNLIELYSINQNGKPEVKRTGTLFPFSQRDMPNHNYIFAMPDLSGQKTYYIRIKTETAL